MQPQLSFWLFWMYSLISDWSVSYTLLIIHCIWTSVQKWLKLSWFLDNSPWCFSEALFSFSKYFVFMSEVVGYEEGDFHNGPETPRGLHQWHDCGPSQENPTHNKVKGWHVGSCLCVSWCTVVLKSKLVLISKHCLSWFDHWKFCLQASLGPQ